MNRPALPPTAVGRIGETLVLLELEKRGWMVFLPHFEKGIDIVGVKQLDEQIKYVAIQVKTATHPRHRKGLEHGIQLRERKGILRHPSLFYIFVFTDLPESERFLIIPSNNMGRTGIHMHKDDTDWQQYQNRFDLLDG